MNKKINGIVERETLVERASKIIEELMDYTTSPDESSGWSYFLKNKTRTLLTLLSKVHRYRHSNTIIKALTSRFFNFILLYIDKRSEF